MAKQPAGKGTPVGRLGLMVELPDIVNHKGRIAVRIRNLMGWLILLLVAVGGVARAQRSEKLLPETTRGFVSVLDVDALREKWEKTQLGALMRDPEMQPFVVDLKRQIKEKLSQTGVRLGVSWEDLSDVYGGEVAVAVVQPDGDPTQHALVLLVDVTGHRAEAEALLEKVWQNQRVKGAKRKTERISDVDVTVLTVVDTQEESGVRDVYYAIHRDRLVVADHQAEMADVLARINGGHQPALDAVPAFQQCMAQCLRNDVDGEIRWFVEPFGYAEVARAANPSTERKQDLIKVLSNQGFREAIQGLGGHVYLADGEHDVLHRTMVFAPPVKREEGDTETTRYRLAARMLDFPNREDLQPYPFIPATTATYVSLSWRMSQAFEYSKSLVNELIGSEKDQDLFEEVLGSLKTDPDGPRVDIRNEIVKHLAERATIISEPRLPVTTKSEQILVLVELKDVEPVRNAINRLMESDADAKKHMIAGATVWEMVPEKPPVEIPDLEVFDPFADDVAVPKPEGEAEKKLAVPKNSAITVANGYLIVSNHIAYIRQFLTLPEDTPPLAQQADYVAVHEALEGLGAGTDAIHFFTRTDLAYQTTYELLKQGKMPEAETLLAKLLNRVLASEDSDEPRKQQIDGSKLPAFQAVAKYLGPAGTYVRSRDDGWFASGCLLRRAEVVSQASKQAEEGEVELGDAATRR